MTRSGLHNNDAMSRTVTPLESPVHVMFLMGGYLFDGGGWRSEIGDNFDGVLPRGFQIYFEIAFSIDSQSSFDSSANSQNTERQVVVPEEIGSIRERLDNKPAKHLTVYALVAPTIQS